MTTRNVRASSSCSALQLSTVDIKPASKTTVGPALPASSMCSRWVPRSISFPGGGCTLQSLRVPSFWYTTPPRIPSSTIAEIQISTWIKFLLRSSRELRCLILENGYGGPPQQAMQVRRSRRSSDPSGSYRRGQGSGVSRAGDRPPLLASDGPHYIAASPSGISKSFAPPVLPGCPEFWRFPHESCVHTLPLMTRQSPHADPLERSLSSTICLRVRALETSSNSRTCRWCSSPPVAAP